MAEDQGAVTVPTDESAPLHTMNPTGRFSDRAAEYALYRPSYPKEAIDAILNGLGDPGALVVADVGAGTGISARLFAGRGSRVVAVEPNAGMRSAAATDPPVEWRDGTAESMGLTDGSVDVVVAAQAYHWFDAPRALAEFHRVLRRGGRVALAWNEKDERDATTRAYTAAIRSASTDPAAEKHHRIDPLAGSPLFEAEPVRVFAYAQELPAGGLVGRALSASYVPKSGAGHDRLVAELGGLERRTIGGNGVVRLVYRTFVYLGTRVG